MQNTSYTSHDKVFAFLGGYGVFWSNEKALNTSHQKKSIHLKYLKDVKYKVEHTS